MGKSQKYLDDLERRNASLRLKFEKEAHEREANEIKELVKGYEDWKLEFRRSRV